MSVNNEKPAAEAAKKNTKKSTGTAARSRKKKPAEAADNTNVIKIIDPDQLELKVIAEAMLEKKAQQVCSLDLKSMGTGICDYFVICNADSTTNVLAIADNVEEQMLVQCNRKVLRKQGKENAFWIILDFSNIVVHIFQTEYREFYRLEELWADCVKTTYQE